MLKRKLSVKTLNEKACLMKMFPKGIKSLPIQFRLRSKIERSISKLWKTIVAAKNEN